MKELGEMTRESAKKFSGSNHDYQAEPIERSAKPSRTGQKQDPYVARATARAKVKVKDRIFQLNGGHAN